MEQSPAQAAEQEQAKRQAAFERARRKLAAARMADEQQRSCDDRISKVIGVAVLAVIGAGALALLIWAKPESFDPAIWRSDPVFPVMLGAFLLVIAGGIVYRRLKARRSPAEIALRDFYEAASADGWDADKLSRHVIQADLDDAERRPPAFENGIIRPERLDSPDALKRYWRSMFRPGFMLRYESKVRAVRLTQIADDLALAHIDIRVYRFSWLMATVLMTGLGIAWAVAGEHIESLSWKMLLLGLATWAVIMLFEVLPRFRKADFTTRKLLVRCGDDWRLFCGDWEGWEEADLSWLDEQEPRAVCEASVV